MKFIIALVLSLACVFGSYYAVGGKMDVLWQPQEFVIIFGAAFGAYFIANPKALLLKSLRYLKKVLSGLPNNKTTYLHLLLFLHETFKVAKAKGLLSIENDIDNPGQSALFKKYPKLSGNKAAVTFFCDYMRMMNMGLENHHELEEIMTKELEETTKHLEEVPDAIYNFAEGLPGLGIVAAVLGVIKTMGSVSEPPEVLGKLLGGALVGTFLGVLSCYGVVGPMANYIRKYIEDELIILECLRMAILGYAQGSAPYICVEMARKIIPEGIRPTFQEVYNKVNS